MTVRVANDFKTEAQLAHEQLVLDNKNQRDKIRQLEAQLEKLTKSKYRLCVKVCSLSYLFFFNRPSPRMSLSHINHTLLNLHTTNPDCMQ